MLKTQLVKSRAPHLVVSILWVVFSGIHSLNLLPFSQDNAELMSQALPQLTQLLSDSDPTVVAQATQVAHQLTKKDASRHAIVNNPSVVSALVHAMASSNDSEVQRSTAGALHSISSEKYVCNVCRCMCVWQCVVQCVYVIRSCTYPGVVNGRHFVLQICS